MNRRQHPDGAKAQARTIYQAHGSRRAAEVTGISRRTINAWSKAEGWQRRLATGQRPDLRVAPVAPVTEGQQAPAKGTVAPSGSYQPMLLLERVAGELWAELDTLAGYRQAGKAREARETAVTVGILLDKAERLAKLTGADRGHLDPATSVGRIMALLDAVERRAGA